jgi:hypothetical protein
MTSLSERLRRLLADECPLVDEEAFLQALLTDAIYAHVPARTPPGRIQFVQFVRPDNGQTTLPLFTDHQKADFAAQGNVRVLGLPGRQMLALTYGATLMLNPNDEQYTLYPEEAAALLEGRPIGGISTEEVVEGAVKAACPPTVPVDRLVSVLGPLHAADPMVHASVIMEMRCGPSGADRVLMLIIVTPSAEAERLVRASAVLAQPVLPALSLPLMIRAWGLDEPLPVLWDQSVMIQAPRRPDGRRDDLH